jgi:LPS-assembly lipoprotein
MKFRTSVLMLFLSAVLVTACGWHLRGDFDFPLNLQPLAIEGASVQYGLEQALRERFELNGIRVTHEPSAAVAILVISDEQLSTQILSIGADGKAKEFQLTYETRIMLKDVDAKVLVKPQLIRLRQDYSFDEFQVLGKEAEKRLLRQEMVSEASLSIVNKLNASLKHSPAVP